MSVNNSQSDRTIPLLMYHSIASDAQPNFKTWTVRPHAFAEQMAYLASHGYTPLTVSQYASAMMLKPTALPSRPIVLTFDDGFADFASVALPMLQAHGFVATLYVTTQFVGATSRWLQREGEGDRTMLTWSQINELHGSGVECGGHSHTHEQLDTLPAAMAWREITTCKTMLEQQTGRAVQSFAYPFGYYNSTVRRMVQQAGYTSACAVRYAPSSLRDDRFALARLIVTNATTLPQFRALVAESRPQVHPLVQRVRATVWRTLRRTTGSLRQRSFERSF